MPGALEARLQADLVRAMKERDETPLSVLRMLKSAIQLAMTEKGRSGDLTDADVEVLIRRAIKQREEAAEQYRRGNADDRADQELMEAEILKTYLPQQMDDGELEALMGKILEETGASGPQDMGTVMKRAIQLVAGRADGKRIKTIVTKSLAS